MAIVEATTKTVQVDKTISAQNTFSDWMVVKGQQSVDVSISGTFAATVYVQRSFDNGVTVLDIESFTTPSERVYRAGSDCMIRLGVKTGGYTSGSVVGTLRWSRSE